MDLHKYEIAIDTISDIIILKYFHGNEKKFTISKSQLIDKFEKNNYDAPQIAQPFSVSQFRKNFLFLCQNKPDLVGSIVYLNSFEPSYLINDLAIIPISNTITWHKDPIIDSIAAAEQLFQNVRQKVKQLLNSSKILKKEINEILNLIEPLSGAKHFNDLQYIYWMLYCELRFTLQLLKPDKDFDLSFGFDKEWLDLREGDVPLLNLLSSTSFEEYSEPAFRDNTIGKLKELYNNYKIPDQQNKKPSIVSDSVIKIKMIPFPGKKKNNVININHKDFGEVQNSPFDLLYYLLWLRINYPDDIAAIEFDGTIPLEHINEITKNDEHLDRFGYSWNDPISTRIKDEKRKTVSKINKLLTDQFELNFNPIVPNANKYYMLTNRFQPDNIELIPYDKNI
ncbi:hypothetical protein ACFLZA_00800 [Candidatus Neomarinimicrobiota bacterium]